MAKELPYFKFEPNQWENGNIQMCSREEKGLFLDLCSMYWSRLGDLPIKLVIQKLCAGNATALDSLIEENIFTVKDGSICIDFLNEQLLEFENTSKVNSKNALEGWEKRRKQSLKSDRIAAASKSHSESDAIREDNRKEDKNKEDETKVNKSKIKFNFKRELIEYGFNEILVNDWLIVRSNKKASNTQTAFNSFIEEIESRKCDPNEMLTYCVNNSWAGFKHIWVDNLTKKNNEKPNSNTRSNSNTGYKPASVDREKLLRELAEDAANGNIPGDYSQKRTGR